MTDDEKRQAWLMGLKAGDSLAVTSRNDVIRLEKVKKRTPSGVIVVTFYKGELRFNKDGHHRTSDVWHHRRIMEVTPDVCDKVHRQSMLTKLAKTRFHELKTYTLIEIMILVEKDAKI